jgi:hypothetical protein
LEEQQMVRLLKYIDQISSKLMAWKANQLSFAGASG